MIDRIHDIITKAIIPDEVEVAAKPGEAAPAVPATPAARRIEPLPYVSSSQIIGLLEILDRLKGSVDVFDLAARIGRDFGSTIAVVKAAELLDFVDTPKQNVVFTETGKKFLAGDINERKLLFRQQLLTLRLFEIISDMLKRTENLVLEEDIVLDQLAIVLPNEDTEKLFEVLVGWGRYGELFGFNADEKMLYLDTGRERFD